jgi:dihydroorotate dehydrogenase (NAD+) catalytic subunit
MNLKVNIGGVEWKNPVTTASGTVNSGLEYSEYVDFSRLGAFTTKSVAPAQWMGNPTPRVAETYGGMLNAIGLQNLGVEQFIKKDIPFLKTLNTNIIVNICGRSVEDFIFVARKLTEEALSETNSNGTATINMLELNLSCPNVKEGGMAFSQDPSVTELIVAEVKKVTHLPLITKLSPNVTDITKIAKAAESGGASALSLINTLLGMKIDITTKKPVLGNVFGGLSGPAIKPVALRCVYQAAGAVKIPIIGMGGISTAEDALEFLLAGASAIAVGTAHFANPTASTDILDGITHYMQKHGVDDINELIGVGRV